MRGARWTDGDARLVVGDARAMRQEVHALKHGLAGRLRLAAIPTALAIASAKDRIESSGVDPVLMSPAEFAAMLRDDAHPMPGKADFAQRIQSLIDMRVRLQLVYTGGMFWRYNHRSQWQDAFRAHGAVATVPCDFLPDVDHTASTLHAQRRLIESTTRFATLLP